MVLLYNLWKYVRTTVITMKLVLNKLRCKMYDFFVVNFHDPPNCSYTKMFSLFWSFRKGTKWLKISHVTSWKWVIIHIFFWASPPISPFIFMTSDGCFFNHFVPFRSLIFWLHFLYIMYSSINMLLYKKSSLPINQPSNETFNLTWQFSL